MHSNDFFFIKIRSGHLRKDTCTYTPSTNMGKYQQPLATKTIEYGGKKKNALLPTVSTMHARSWQTSTDFLRCQLPFLFFPIPIFCSLPFFERTKAAQKGRPLFFVLIQKRRSLRVSGCWSFWKWGFFYFRIIFGLW